MKGNKMGRWTNKIKDRACELSEGYEEARDEAFNEEFQEFVSYIKDARVCLSKMTYDDVQGFLDSFTFPDEGDWAMDQAQNELDDIGDQKYEQWRDERDER